MSELNEKDLQILRRIIDINTDGAMTKKEAINLFKVMVQFLTKLSNQVTALAVKIEGNSNTTLKNIDSKFSNSLEDLKKKLDALFVEDKMKNMDFHMKEMFAGLKQEMSKMMEQKMKQADHRMSQLKNGPPGPKGDPGPVATQEMIAKAMEGPAKEFEKKWENMVQGLISKKTMAGATPHNLLQIYNASSQADGFRRILTGLPIARHYPMIFLRGQQQANLAKDVDFTVGRGSITLLNHIEPPQSGVGVYVQFIK